MNGRPEVNDFQLRIKALQAYTPITDTSLKKNISKIKKLITQRDYGLIDSGIELARSLDQKHIFEELLKDCSIDVYGNFVQSKMFSGSSPAQPYLNRALLSLIAYAPENSKINKSLKRCNIKSLNLNSIEMLLNLDLLANMKNLTYLDLGWCNVLENVDSLAKFTKINNLVMSGVEALESFDFLANLTNLTNLNLEWCETLENVDALANLTNLTELNLENCRTLKNVDGLANLTNLTELNLRCCFALKNVNGLAKLTNLTSLNLSVCKALENIDSLDNLPNLNSLDLRASLIKTG
jgi:Leucine-rich repeat (LRR) protein